jgi:5-methylthioadenosine/S-adenosylhomocysteine deaminase
MKEWSINGALILTPDEELEGSSVEIRDNRIDKVSKEKHKTSLEVTIENGILTPGLINGHDHLLGTYYPKVGNGPYENWLPWDNDLKSAPVYQERQQIENLDLYLLGAFRNLVSGVTTVSDLMPHFVADQFVDKLPMRAIRDYALAHSIASFALAWGDGVEAEYKKALKEDIPFITHISEGFDPETRQDVKTLDQKGALGDHCVLVHCLSFSKDDIKLVKQKGASAVWCADSNMFMYNKTADIKGMLDAGLNVCIGTDSPMSGGLNLLYEMRFDRALYKRLYGTELSYRSVLDMVTINSAKAFRLKKTGQVKTGFVADLAVFKHKSKDPYESVVHAALRDVMMVVINGSPVYADAEYANLFDSLKVTYQRVTVDGVQKVIKGDPVGLLKRISKAVGFKKEFPFLPVEFHV